MLEPTSSTPSRMGPVYRPLAPCTDRALAHARRAARGGTGLRARLGGVRRPGRPEQVVRADLTWLLSAWTCIYGRGCAGVVEGRADDGCCSHGAFFTDDEDLARVTAAVAADRRRTGSSPGRPRRLAEETSSTSRGRAAPVRTRTVDGACVFLNRPGFSGGDGCALHRSRCAPGAPAETKPDVCWQLPVRRKQECVDRPDDSRVLRRRRSASSTDAAGGRAGRPALVVHGAPDAHVGARRCT